jgi:CHASE1-domain containing sensor protein
MYRLTTSVWFRKLRETHPSLLVGILFCLAILLTYWVNALRAPYVGTNFLYAADLQTKYSLYDTAQKRYAGDQYGVTTYSVQPIRSNTATTTVESIMRTTSLDNIIVHTTEQKYTIDKLSGQQIGLFAPKAKPAYLFAPRNIPKDTSFNYYHPGYNSLATMDYDGQEVINGLKTYRYTARFADRIESDIPGSDTQGREYVPTLRLWIEPTTGWLIKFQDSATQYFYDKKTGERQSPISHAASSFTDASIRQNAAYARQLKYGMEFGQQIAPSILLACLLLAALVAFVKRLPILSLPVKGTAAIVIGAGLANLLGWVLHFEPLTRLFIDSTGISPQVAFCFILVGTSLLLIYSRKLRHSALYAGLFLIVVSILSALHNMHILPFDASNVLLRQLYDPSFGFPDGMSLYGNLAFFVLGVSISKAAITEWSPAFSLAQMTAGMAVTLGLSGLLAKLLLLDQVFIVPFMASLSITGSILCIFCGMGLMQIMVSRYGAIHYKRQTVALFRALARPVVMTIPLILIGIVAQIQQIKLTADAQAAFNQRADQVQGALQDSVDDYGNAVTGARALYAASQRVERSEWHDYIAALNVEQQYPGMQGVGFAGFYPKDELATALKQIRQSDADFTIFPAGDRSQYVPVVYIEPSDSEANRKLLGYDLSTNEVRAAALYRAATTGQTTISSKLSLLQETGRNVRGFMMLIPVYTNGMATQTVAERQKALEGYVYAPFLSTTFFDTIVKRQHVGLQVSVYDGFDTDSETLLYGQGPTKNDDPTRIVEKRTMYAGGRPWTVVYSADRSFATSDSQERVPGLILVGGGIGYIVAIIGYVWIRSLIQRSRGIRR